MNWLASLFHVEKVWVDKGQGKWVKRRRYHPLTRVVFVVVVLTLGISWAVDFFYSEKSATPPSGTVTSRDNSVPTSDEPQIREPHVIDFMPASIDRVTPPALDPAFLPPGLAVNEDEYGLRINKGGYKLYLYRGNKVDRTYSIAVGKNLGDKQRRGDHKTPNGIFTVQSIENASGWSHDFLDGKGVIRGAYGPWFIRLKTGWQGIGIHGTHDPDSRGSRATEGCIRLSNDELEELRQFAFREMKVVIEE